MLKKDNQGFALLIAISFMAIAMVSIVAIASFSKMEGRLASLRFHEGIARQNARMGLTIAFSEIQASLGSDFRSTRFVNKHIEILDTKSLSTLHLPTLDEKIFSGEVPSDDSARYPNKGHFSYSIIEEEDWLVDKRGVLVDTVLGCFKENLSTFLAENSTAENTKTIFIPQLKLLELSKIPRWSILKSFKELCEEAMKGRVAPHAQDYPNNHGVGPVLLGFSCHYDVLLDTTKNTLTIIPQGRCVLWNPYDTSLDESTYTVQLASLLTRPLIDVIALGGIDQNVFVQYELGLAKRSTKEGTVLFESNYRSSFFPGEVKETKFTGEPYIMPLSQKDMQEFLFSGIKLRYDFNFADLVLRLLDTAGKPYQFITNIKPLQKPLDSRQITFKGKKFEHRNVLKFDLVANDFLDSNIRAIEHLCLPEKPAMRSRFEINKESQADTSLANKRYTWKRFWTAPVDESLSHDSLTIPFKNKIEFHLPHPEKVVSSVAFFQQANLAPMGYDPSRALGESGKHDLLKVGEFFKADEKYPVVDYAYFLNEALWDRFYFYNEKGVGEMYEKIEYKNRESLLAEKGDFAKTHFIKNAFNVNSASEKEWYELLTRVPQLATPEKTLLAKNITQALSKRERPFASLAEFVNRDAASVKGFLQQALDSSSIDRVTQGQLLEEIAGRLTVRADTLLVRAYGDSLNDAGGVIAQIECEAVVQRFPKELPGNSGRCFKITAFRWLN
ncbi:MAG: hypothetical protein COZ46_05225 [Verrucomicrobia bacterium CG_4_10_14_3_um_filter_43_23]|nr:MAG: hypothetical protein COZ46_05225 [Verrucomicrobia bacterium CG_4_10_14_3_um_filter_43_23]